MQNTFLSKYMTLLFRHSTTINRRCIQRTYCKSRQIIDSKLIHSNIDNSVLCRRCALSSLYISTRKLKNFFGDRDGKDKSPFIPIEYNSNIYDDDGHGQEIAGPLKKADVLRLIEKFYIDPAIKELAEEHGLDKNLYQQTMASFRKFCSDSKSLPAELHIVVSDILKGAGHTHDLYPYFLKHARTIFPHLECIKELEKISDLTQPPNWYPEARKMNRKIIYHAGPTNSGKTYHAMEQFLSADSGVYCGPLKLLASEIYQKSNDRGTPCDLVTGEEKKYAVSQEEPASHIACTVEMTSLQTKYDVAIIDEIQIISDSQRGWAWTRALLGICAKEIHVCGDASSIEILKELALIMGEDIEIHHYKRLTSLNILKAPLESVKYVRPGDCIVCFSKKSVLEVAQNIERLGHEVAVIYGGLPPASKIAQANRFNDPKHPCKVLVATDAIGMGLNLSIRRIIFHSLMKPCVNEKGETEMDTISCSQALQIAGRAGRYGTQFEEGYVTTLNCQDLSTLTELLNKKPETVEQCGVHPTSDQIEIFAYHLPDYSLSRLVEVFVNICSVDSSLYFLCLLDDFKFMADLIQHISLPLRTRYVFCCAPISKQKPIVAAMFLKFARQYSENEVISLEWLCRQVKWPLPSPKTAAELVHLENVFDVFDLYLWLSYRFQDMFPDAEMVRALQVALDNLIFEGVSHITQLLKDSVSSSDVVQESDKSSTRITRNKNTMKKNLTNFSLDRLKVQDSRLKSKFSERLLKQGVISRNMLDKLKEEWRQESSGKGKKSKDYDN